VLERFVLGFSGTQLPDEMAALLASSLAGVAIYARNYNDPIGLRALTDAIRREERIEWIGVRHEEVAAFAAGGGGAAGSTASGFAGPVRAAS